MSASTAARLHYSPSSGRWLRCIAEVSCWYESHSTPLGIAQSGGAEVSIHGRPQTISPIFDGAYSIGTAQRSQTFREDGTKLTPTEARAWRREQAKAEAGMGPEAETVLTASVPRSAEELEAERLEAEKREAERLEAERLEARLAAMPSYRQIYEADEKEWLAMPWRQRRPIIEAAAKELIAQTAADYPDSRDAQNISWGGWGRDSSAVAYCETYNLYDSSTGGRKYVSRIFVCAEQAQHYGPATTLNALNHEVGHGLTPNGAHGDDWKSTTAELFQANGIGDQEPHTHAAKLSEAEAAAAKALRTEKRAQKEHNRKRFVAVCPNGFKHYSATSPSSFYGCRCEKCEDQGSAPTLRYEKNPDFVSWGQFKKQQEKAAQMAAA